MASKRRKHPSASKSQDILELVRPLRNEAAAQAPLHALESKASRSRGGSWYVTAEEPPQQTAKPPAKPRRSSRYFTAEEPPQQAVIARSRYGSRYDTAEWKVATGVSPMVNSRLKSITSNKGEKFVDHVRNANKPFSSALRHVPEQQIQVPPRSMQVSKYELPAKTPERHDKARARSIIQFQRGIAAEDPKKTKATQSAYKRESQLYVTAPEPAKAGYEVDPDLDNQETNLSWPCMCCTMALFVTMCLLILSLLIESRETLTSMETTTTTNAVNELTTAVPQQREMIESTPLKETSASTRAERSTATDVTDDGEEEDSNVPTMPSVS